MIYLLGYYPLNFQIDNGIHKIGFEEIIDRLFSEYYSTSPSGWRNYARDLRGVKSDRNESNTYTGPVGLKHFNDLNYTPYPPVGRYSSYIAGSFYYIWGQHGMEIQRDFPVYRNFHTELSNNEKIDNLFSELVQLRLNTFEGLSAQERAVIRAQRSAGIISEYPEHNLIIPIENRRRRPNQISQQERSIPDYDRYRGFSGTVFDELFIQDNILSNTLIINENAQYIQYNFGHYYNLNKNGTVISVKYPDRMHIDDLRSVSGYTINNREIYNQE